MGGTRGQKTQTVTFLSQSVTNLTSQSTTTSDAAWPCPLQSCCLNVYALFVYFLRVFGRSGSPPDQLGQARRKQEAHDKTEQHTNTNTTQRNAPREDGQPRLFCLARRRHTRSTCSLPHPGRNIVRLAIPLPSVPTISPSWQMSPRRGWTMFHSAVACVCPRGTVDRHRATRGARGAKGKIVP
jgi:hypothetical protein